MKHMSLRFSDSWRALLEDLGDYVRQESDVEDLCSQEIRAYLSFKGHTLSMIDQVFAWLAQVECGGTAQEVVLMFSSQDRGLNLRQPSEARGFTSNICTIVDQLMLKGILSDEHYQILWSELESREAFDWDDREIEDFICDYVESISSTLTMVRVKRWLSHSGEPLIDS